MLPTQEELDQYLAVSDRRASVATCSVCGLQYPGYAFSRGSLVVRANDGIVYQTNLCRDHAQIVIVCRLCWYWHDPNTVQPACRQRRGECRLEPEALNGTDMDAWLERTGVCTVEGGSCRHWVQGVIPSTDEVATWVGMEKALGVDPMEGQRGGYR